MVGGQLGYDYSGVLFEAEVDSACGDRIRAVSDRVFAPNLLHWQTQLFVLRMHPELHTLIVEAAAASVVPNPATSFPPDIEEEANLYFQKVGRSIPSLL